MAGKGLEKYFPIGGNSVLSETVCLASNNSWFCTRQKGHTGVHIAAGGFWDIRRIGSVLRWWEEGGAPQPAHTLPDFPEEAPPVISDRPLGRALLTTYVHAEPKAKKGFLPGDEVVYKGKRVTVKATKRTATRGEMCLVVWDGTQQVKDWVPAIQLSHRVRSLASGRSLLVDK